MDEREALKAHIPVSMQQLIADGHTDKVASIVTGIDEFSLEKVALFLGNRRAQRRTQMRPIVDGLLALNNLTQG